MKDDRLFWMAIGLTILAAIALIFLAFSGCGTVDRTYNREGNMDTNSDKVSMLAKVSIVCRCPTHMDGTGRIIQERSCGMVGIFGEYKNACLPFYREVLIKTGEYLDIQYVTESTAQHQIRVSLPDTSYVRTESGTVSLLERIK